MPVGQHCDEAAHTTTNCVWVLTRYAQNKGFGMLTVSHSRQAILTSTWTPLLTSTIRTGRGSPYACTTRAVRVWRRGRTGTASASECRQHISTYRYSLFRLKAFLTHFSVPRPSTVSTFVLLFCVPAGTPASPRASVCVHCPAPSPH